MGISRLPYVRKNNKLHFFTYQIITFVFPTLNARKLANLLYSKSVKMEQSRFFIVAPNRL